MEVKYLQIRKENIFTKFINFFRKALYKPKNSIEDVSVNNEDDKKAEFINSIKIEQDDPHIIDLQNKFENKEIELTSLSYEEIHDLKLLYQKQIENLKKKIENKKNEIKLIKSTT